MDDVREPPGRALESHQIIVWLRAEMRRITGRDYRIDFAALTPSSLRELQRFLRDVEHERVLASNRARMNPWRRG